jgi:hypothetical protein
VDDKFGTFGLGMTIRSENPEAMYGPAGRFPAGGTGTTGRVGAGTGATGRTGVGTIATGRTGVGIGAFGRTGACTGTGGVTGGFTGGWTPLSQTPHSHPNLSRGNIAHDSTQVLPSHCRILYPQIPKKQPVSVSLFRHFENKLIRKPCA